MHILDAFCPSLPDKNQRFEIDMKVSPSGYGGFGAVYPVHGVEAFVAKRIPMGVPRPFSDHSLYTAHIVKTRRRFEKILSSTTSSFVRNLINELIASLSVGWAVDVDDEFRMTALWLIMRRAAGIPLEEAFRTPAPSMGVRRNIARSIVSRMRTLRRTDLVHLDCVGENIYVDLDSGRNPQVTLIDLDGSGVIHRAQSYTDSSDRWDHRPFTLGHVNTVRVPPWYPQSGIQADPRSGNYLYAERWVVVDTVLRTLSWNRLNALSWVDHSARVSMADGYENVRNQINIAKYAHRSIDQEEWRMMYARVIEDTAHRVGVLEEYDAPTSMPKVTSQFANLLQRAYFDPHELSGERLANGQQLSPYATFDTWLSQTLA